RPSPVAARLVEGEELPARVEHSGESIELVPQRPPETHVLRLLSGELTGGEGGPSDLRHGQEGLRGQIVRPVCHVEPERPDRRTAQLRQMATDPEVAPDVARDRSDVGAARA